MTMRSSTVTKNNKKSLIAFRFAIGLFVLGFGLSNQAAAAIECNRTLTADIVAFDMPLMWNRLGAHNINGQMFALKRDVVFPLLTAAPPYPAGSPCVQTNGLVRWY
jgi:hypothetical protein